MSRSAYFTTPIYYVNAEPHIGHLYTTMLADVLKRFHQMLGDDVYFLTGTDEHGEKIAESATAKGVDPQSFTDQISGLFRSTWTEIGVDFDDFIRTTDERHKTYVQQILQQVYDAGDIYFDEYTGLYCVGCERYFTQTELVDGKCPDHQTTPKEVKEANYFFRMGNYQQALIDHIEQNPQWIRPERYRNEVLSFLKNPLEDLCISRPKTRLTWGIDLPFDDKYVTYVWFDALLNYVSALKQSGSGKDLFERYWPHCNHLIGKDILKTHAIYWPTMLMAAGIELYRQIDVHGFWLLGESKMSKSLGNVIRPLTFDKQFGIENLRYFFFREMKFGADASFSYELFVERYNADLANGLGNLLSRTGSLIKKNLGGVIPKVTEFEAPEQALIDLAAQTVDGFVDHFENRQFHLAVDALRKLQAAADGYINETQPWRLAKEETQREALERVLYTGLEIVRILATLLSPIMPRACRNILEYLGAPSPCNTETPFAERVAWGGLPAGHSLGNVPRTFPRIDEKKIKEITAQAEAAAPPSGGKPAKEEKKNDFRPLSPEITIDDFAAVDLRVGVIKEASLVDGAKKLIKLMVDLGEGRLRQIFAGIRSAYPEPQALLGKQVLVVANLKPRQMKFGLSEGMVCAGGGGTERLCVATFDGELLPGDSVS